MARALLILPTATYRAADFLKAADELDVDLVVASEEPRTLTEDFVLIDLKRPEWSAAQVEHFARATPVDAVVPVDDAGVLVAALAATRLGLAHSAPHAVGVTRNKAMLRRALAAARLPQPPFAVAEPGDDEGSLCEQIGLPCVIKPLSLSGSRGVIRVDDAHRAPVTAERIRRILAAAGENPNSPLLVEQFVPGAEIAWEGVLRNGELEPLAVFDKPDASDGPYFEETIYVTPSRHHPEILLEARDLVARAAEAVGLTEGPVHAELRIDAGRLLFLEVAARSIGGLCGRALRFGLMGRSLESVLLRNALRLPPRSTEREDVASGVMMIPIPRAGILEEVRGREAALAVAGITALEITIPVGHTVVPLPEGDRYLGFLFAKAAGPEEAEVALREAYSGIEVLIAS